MPMRILVVSDTTLDHWPALLRKASGGQLSARTAPSGQLVQVMADGGHPAWRDGCDALVIWCSPASVSPAFGDLARHQVASFDTVLSETRLFLDRVLDVATRVPRVILVGWALAPWRRLVQGLGRKSGQGLADLLMRMNITAAEHLQAAANITITDLPQWFAQFRGRIYDPRLWAVAKMDYSLEFLDFAAAEVWALMRGLSGQSRKIVICDLDNTLWGGVIGDDGLDGIRLGGHDPIGESYRRLQQELKVLRNRGIVLGICSKNNEAIALDAVSHHPEMVLRPDDFAAWRINWEDKAQTVGELLAELRLLPASAVFLDDNPSERDRVRRQYPDMLVPDLDGDVAAWPALVASLDCFETGALTAEDQARAGQYRGEVERNRNRDSHGTLEEWLASLELRVEGRPLGRQDLPRAAQLLNKTNQFNLTTRRMEEKTWFDWYQRPGRLCLVFRVSDRFGDSGLTGIVGGTIQNRRFEVMDFVMSCRVMGKGIEDAMVAAVAGLAREFGAERLQLRCVPNAKNLPMQEYVARLGRQGSVDIAHDLQVPPHIAMTLSGLTAATLEEVG